ncbi:MAG TPA: N-acetylmuramoyl-L-alanine amidase [Candidatus Acidoferrum sp.]|nr:N-acetylmuramoyl-L-alanine amidase [Candidatus Acidoferrum sp.]
MSLGQKNFHKLFAGASLGFTLLGWSALPCPATAATTRSNVKREAAGTQFTKAEEQRAALNAKAPEKRTLAEYKQVASSYRRVYLITPHATEVPDALFAVGELNTEMGDHFGRSYYQAAVDSYGFLIREYPASRYVQDAMLRAAQLQKAQLGDSAAATKSFQDFQKKFPRSTHKREVQEALAELALMRSAEAGDLTAKNGAPANSPVAVSVTAPKSDAAGPPARKATSGGERAKSVDVPRVQQIKTSVKPDGAEVLIELEDSVQYVSGRIANPDRIYFDLHAARLSPNVARGNVQVSGNLLSKVRVAQNQAGVVRVVLDVNGVQDYAASLLKRPTRLVIELYSISRGAKPEAVETAKANGNGKTSPKGSGDDPAPAVRPPTAPVLAQVMPAPVTAPAAAFPEPSAGKLTRTKTTRGSTKPELVQPTTAPQPTRDGQSTLTRTLGLKIGRIVIDPGHGGHDTGTIGPTGLMEKDLCLDVALRLGKIIQQKLPGADIVYTRSDDTFIPLEERTHIANEAKADLFISIHANSSPDHGARGVETYYLNLRGSPEAMAVAARENAVSQESIHDLEDVVKQIARTEKIDESKELAEDVQDSLSRRIQKTARPVRNRGVRKAPFVVLIGADMPSILTEISFLSNPSDEQLLKKPEHRQRVAEGLYQGMATYLENLNSMAGNSFGKPNQPAVIPAVEQSRNQK